MNKLTFSRIAVIVIIFLLVVNLTALLTLGYGKWNNMRHMRHCKPQHKEHFEGLLSKEIGLSEAQIKQFKSIKSSFHQNSGRIFKELDSNKKIMFDELAKPKSDTAVLNKIILQDGELHKELKKLLVDHFMEIKAITNDIQCKKYFEFVCQKCEGDNCQMPKQGPPRPLDERF